MSDAITDPEDQNPTQSKARPPRWRGFYLLPTLFSVGNVYCGYLSISKSSSGFYDHAAILIMVATVLDVLDGRIARLTGTTSKFGEAYDSLADMVSFGVAPAMLAYHWGLETIPRFGLSASFLFLVAGSIRLARFNSSPSSLRYFSGLPIPAGAAAMAMLALVHPEPIATLQVSRVLIVYVVAVALLMVSTLPYRTFKDINFKRQRPIRSIFLIGVGFALLSSRPVPVLALFVALYLVSAPIAVTTRLIRLRSIRKRRLPMTTSLSKAEVLEDDDRADEAKDDNS